MIIDNQLAPAHLFATTDDRIVPLISGRDLRLALQRYRISPIIFGLIANIPDANLEKMLKGGRLQGTALDWYCRMRRYEHKIAQTIQQDVRLFGESVLPRYLSDRHMATYSPSCWDILPSSRLASGISAWVSSHYANEDGSKVRIYDFNQVRYSQWLDEHELDHDPLALDFWLAKQNS